VVTPPAPAANVPDVSPPAVPAPPPAPTSNWLWLLALAAIAMLTGAAKLFLFPRPRFAFEFETGASSLKPAGSSFTQGCDSGFDIRFEVGTASVPKIGFAG
jgi:hypothetical protein